MAVTAGVARRDVVRLIEQVNVDRPAVEIVSKKGSAVLMSKDEYDALMETDYLLSSPANALRLMSALASVERKGIQARADEQGFEADPDGSTS